MTYDINHVINHVYTGTPDYFAGTNLPTVQVEVDSNTTYQDIKDMLLDSNYSHLYQLELKEEFQLDIYEQAVEDIFSDIARLGNLGNTPYVFEDIEYCEDYPCYSIFTVNLVEQTEQY